MDEKYKLLDQIHHDSSMAAYNIERLLKDLEDKDNKIKPYLKEILKKYDAFEKESKNMLDSVKIDSKDPSLMSKMASSMKVDKEVINDNSDSAIADLMIKGVLMGLNKIEKHLSEYGKELSEKQKHLAQDFLKFQNEVIDNLKEYL